MAMPKGPGENIISLEGADEKVLASAMNAELGVVAGGVRGGLKNLAVAAGAAGAAGLSIGAMAQGPQGVDGNAGSEGVASQVEKKNIQWQTVNVNATSAEFKSKLSDLWSAANLDGDNDQAAWEIARDALIQLGVPESEVAYVYNPADKYSPVNFLNIKFTDGENHKEAGTTRNQEFAGHWSAKAAVYWMTVKAMAPDRTVSSTETTKAPVYPAGAPTDGSVPPIAYEFVNKTVTSVIPAASSVVNKAALAGLGTDAALNQLLSDDIEK